MARNVSISKSIDWPILVAYIALVIFGWMSVYGASYDFENPDIFSFDQRAGRQLVWIACSFFIATAILLIDYRVYDVFAYFIYAVAIMLLVATIFLAPDIKGSRSWLVFGPVSIQPAELAKFATGLALAKCMSAYNFVLKGFKSYASVLLIIFLPIVLIFLQQETGTALVFMSFAFALYREGMPGVILYIATCCVALFVLVICFGTTSLLGGASIGTLTSILLIGVSVFVFLIFNLKDIKTAKLYFKVAGGAFLLAVIVNYIHPLDVNYFGYAVLLYFVSDLLWRAMQTRKFNYAFIGLFIIMAIGYSFSVNYVFDNALQPHQQSRIRVAFGLEDDLAGSGYNVNQSKIAIGSGEFLGKGFLKGTQTKLNYVPEQDTDFIFCTVGEEFGFLGSFVVLSVYLFFMLRLVQIAERQKEAFNRIYGYCVASVFLFHFFVNVGMVLGLAPVIGIPLPFFSYGGSSLWGFTILLFILLRLDASRLDH